MVDYLLINKIISDTSKEAYKPKYKIDDETKTFIIDFVDAYDDVVQKSLKSQKPKMYSELLTLFENEDCSLYDHIKTLRDHFTYNAENVLINDVFKLRVYIDDEE